MDSLYYVFSVNFNGFSSIICKQQENKTIPAPVAQINGVLGDLGIITVRVSSEFYVYFICHLYHMGYRGIYHTDVPFKEETS